VDEIYGLTAGHPNFTAHLMKEAIAALNDQRRNVLTLTDVELAADRVVRSSGSFNTSWFSPQNLTAEEMDASVRLAKAIAESGQLSMSDARTQGVNDSMLRSLADQCVLRTTGTGALQIRGGLLASYLERMVGSPPARRSRGPAAASVGLFIDLENITRLPEGLSSEQLCRGLYSFAAEMGDVVAPWAAYCPWNIEHRLEWKASLAKANIATLEVPDNLRRRDGTSKDGLADKRLIRQVGEEIEDKQLDILIYVSGDQDLFTPIPDDISAGRRVVVLSWQGQLAEVYERYASERRDVAISSGLREPDFKLAYIDDLVEQWRML
jgi:hypothetical protein